MKTSLRRSRRAAVVAGLLLAFGIAVTASGAAVAPRATIQEVTEGMTCQCGCGLTVANCNHPNCSFAVPLRVEIERMLDRGLDRAAILAAFRHKYGEKILSAPTTEGFNILAWITPFAALAAGAVLVCFALRRWIRVEQRVSERGILDDSRGASAQTLLRRELRDEVLRRL